ncbi:MAG: hypothetical protein AAGJ37_00435 [Pseudomonadota bacterium]
MPKISDEKMQHYRTQLRVIGEFLCNNVESDAYIRSLIFDTNQPEFEKALRRLIEKSFSQ